MKACLLAKALALVAVLCLFSPSLSFSAQCGETCATSGDCQPNCPFCDTGFTDSCIDCCVFGDNATCTTNYGCTWHGASTQCRNDVGTACASAAPEIPEPLRPWLIVLLFIAVTTYFAARKKEALR